MDSFEQAKIAGAFLIAALAIVLPKTLIDMRAESAAHKAGTAHTADAKPAKPGEHVALTAAATGTAAAPAAGAAAPVDIFALPFSYSRQHAPLEKHDLPGVAAH